MLQSRYSHCSARSGLVCLIEQLGLKRDNKNTKYKVHLTTHSADWRVLRSVQVTFEENPRRQFLQLLGYDTDELNKKVSKVL